MCFHIIQIYSSVTSVTTSTAAIAIYLGHCFCDTRQRKRLIRNMWPFSKKGVSGFSWNSTAEQVTHGIDATGLTAIVTG